VFGVGPVLAAYLIGYSGDVRRFATAGHYARYNGTAPIEASSGPRVRHRLNPRGNRQLNHAIHIAAVTQVAHDTPGRAYFGGQICGVRNTTAKLPESFSDRWYRIGTFGLRGGINPNCFIETDGLHTPIISDTRTMNGYAKRDTTTVISRSFSSTRHFQDVPRKVGLTRFDGRPRSGV
jgi:hypothetical protein